MLIHLIGVFLLSVAATLPRTPHNQEALPRPVPKLVGAAKNFKLQASIIAFARSREHSSKQRTLSLPLVSNWYLEPEGSAFFSRLASRLEPWLLTPSHRHEKEKSSGI